MIKVSRSALGNGVEVVIPPGHHLREIRCADDAREPLTLSVPDDNDTFRAELDRRQALPESDQDYIGATQPYVAPAPPVPSSVTAAQARIVLLRHKLLDFVKTAVEGDAEAAIWFEYATVWERQNPHVVALGTSLLGDDAVLDGLFVEAAAIAA